MEITGMVKAYEKKDHYYTPLIKVSLAFHDEVGREGSNELSLSLSLSLSLYIYIYIYNRE
jgi:hypothetical protein